jgi:hypothetical protein
LVRLQLALLVLVLLLLLLLLLLVVVVGCGIPASDAGAALKNIRTTHMNRSSRQLFGYL